VLLKGYEVFRFVWNYALPIVVFAFCYYRILMVLRRQNKVVGTHAAPPDACKLWKWCLFLQMMAMRPLKLEPQTTARGIAV